jgi:hypothetical protein
MSTVIGSQLPPRLFARLSGPVADRPLLAVQMATVDPADWPHPALLSYGEVVALDPGRLRFAVGRDSVTAANLRRSGRVTFCLVEPGMVHYVKASARPLGEALPDAPALAGFDAVVETVLRDEPRPDEAGGAVQDGIRFAPGGAPGRLRDRWGALLARLRDAA